VSSDLFESRGGTAAAGRDALLGESEALLGESEDDVEQVVVVFALSSGHDDSAIDGSRTYSIVASYWAEFLSFILE